MSSITVSLPEEELAPFKAVAAAVGRTPEEVARAGIEKVEAAVGRLGEHRSTLNTADVPANIDVRETAA